MTIEEALNYLISIGYREECIQKSSIKIKYDCIEFYTGIIFYNGSLWEANTQHTEPIPQTRK